MSAAPLVLLVPACAGMMAYKFTRRAGIAAGWFVWSIFIVAAFVAIRAWYGTNSNCHGAETIYVPLVGAFAAASGAWVGITRAKNVQQDYFPLRIAVESAVYALVPGAFFILLLWPCG